MTQGSVKLAAVKVPFNFDFQHFEHALGAEYTVENHIIDKNASSSGKKPFHILLVSASDLQ
jgi:hypothetical protein